MGTDRIGKGGLERSVLELGIRFAEQVDERHLIAMLHDSEPTDPEVQSPAYQSAARECHPESVSLDFDNLAGVPEGSTELTSQFKSLVFDVDKELGSTDEYDRCMTDSGVALPKMGDSEGWQKLYNYLTGIMPLPPLAGEEPSQEWTEYRSTEKDAIEADAQCREAKYMEGLAMLDSRLADFEKTHATEISSMATAWQRTVERARSDGYAG